MVGSFGNVHRYGVISVIIVAMTVVYCAAGHRGMIDSICCLENIMMLCRSVCPRNSRTDFVEGRTT